ncbi:MAG: type I-C CRISPR-associated protein Cas8c/Csd1 [Anaerolineaceae bacterium]|nr:MAG: type I-C CRISPR-associated protein Cas8c/Csd1 [Anaerolineaceae bacterium]
MSWIQKLHETYNNCQSSIGYSGKEGSRPLLPICHITAQAHIEIVINKNGDFRRASLITEKSSMATIIPCTESSSGKVGSKPVNHPLCDKLQYVAGDFVKYGGTVTSGFAKDPDEPHRNYVQMLTEWNQSKFGHPKTAAILKYVGKKTVVKDLVEQKILFVRKGKFSEKSEVAREKNAKDVFSILNSQEDAFIRWIVESPDVEESKTWKDKSLWDSWINYYLSSKEKEPICFVSGEDAILTSNHPKYIRREGDGAKLISSNDTSGFTYRGRFLTDDQAVNVGLEVSQKAHYALLWLISLQGYRKDDLAIVAWATSGAEIPSPMDDAFSILGANDLVSDQAPKASTAQDVAIKLKKKIAGYGKEIGDTTDIVVMGLDSASPGRLSITYYRELKGSDFLQRIDDWHNSCAWRHYYRSITIQDERTGKPKQKFIPFVGAPSPSDIAEAAYGVNRDGKFEVDAKLRKTTVQRILPCIIDRQPIPRDLVESAVRRASNRVGLENWQWNKVLTIACALFKKHNRKENYDMTLDPNRKTRDYLYGRLLALAESLEEWALSKAGEDRPTNAARLMQRFSEHPYSTWRTIELALTPYKARLGGKSKKRQRLIDEVVAAFDDGDFTSDKRLSGEFLLGYHCQREFLRSNRAEDLEDSNESAETSDTK